MIKLVKGVINFHQNVLPGLREQFVQLALGQSPDVLMIACSDSRVVPNLFASTDPGDLFVVRNAGNFVPPNVPDFAGQSEAAAVEIALEMLQVKDIIICGHSHCAGMSSILKKEGLAPNLKQWIRHGQKAKEWLDQGKTFDPSLNLSDQLSQLNVMHQLENLKTYPQVMDRLNAKELRLHAWWFDIGSGNVYDFDAEKGKFIVIDEKEGNRILRELNA